MTPNTVNPRPIRARLVPPLVLLLVLAAAGSCAARRLAESEQNATEASPPALAANDAPNIGTSDTATSTTANATAGAPGASGASSDAVSAAPDQSPAAAVEVAALSVSAERMQSLVTASAVGVTFVTGTDCTAACQSIGLNALNGGNTGQALCAAQDGSGNSVYGTKDANSQGKCSYSTSSSSYSLASTFQCVCSPASPGSVCWEASAFCPTGTQVDSPNVCLFKQPGGTGTVMGWREAGGFRCHFPARNWGAGGGQLAYADGFATGDANARQLCYAPGCPFADGTVVRCDANGAIYRVDAGKLRHFPDMNVYGSWGYPAPAFNDQSFPGCCALNRCPPGLDVEMKGPSTCPSSTLPGVSNGAWPSACNGMGAGATCTATCSSGFTGSPYVTCGSNGAWSTVTGSCSQNLCWSSALPGVSNAVWPSSGCNGVGSGATCTATCSSGFTGSPYVTCGSNGAWSSVMGSCSQNMCWSYALPSVSNAAWPSSGCSGVTSGARCTANCNSGFSGSPYVTCASNGAWTSVTGSCTQTTCSSALLPPLSNAAWPSSGCNGVGAGATCTATCSSGFTGSPYVTCGSSGTWSAITGGCTQTQTTCSSALLPPLSNAVWSSSGCDGVGLGATCTATCSGGSTGTLSVTCGAGGWWSAVSGTCTQNTGPLRKCLEVTATRQGLAQLARDLQAAHTPTTYTQALDCQNGNCPSANTNPVCRWLGICKYVCPTRSGATVTVPAYMDCSSFVAWLYWTAFGAGTDYLSPNNWLSGYTDDMAPRGQVVASTSALQQGDVCFYGYSSNIVGVAEGKKKYGHAAIYVGNSQIVSMGGSGISLLPVDYFTYNTYDTMDCRTYPAFFQAQGTTCPSSSLPSVSNAVWPSSGCNGVGAGTKCTATCNSGFSGSPYVTCGSNGAWSTVTGSCTTQTQTTCSSALLPPLSNAVWPSSGCDGVGLGATCTATCSGGSTGTLSVTCGAGGWWSAVSGTCTQSTTGGCPATPAGYTFYPNKDSWGSDKAGSPFSGDVAYLASLCDADIKCNGFTTNGFLKSSIKGTLDPYAGTCNGLYAVATSYAGNYVPWNYAVDYQKLWSKMTITAASTVSAVVAKCNAGKARYQAVSASTGVPWHVIAIVHGLEANFNFKCVLQNGECIVGTNKKTVKVPAGRGPFATWEASALDALSDPRYQVPAWDLINTLYFFELYNGLGYRQYHPEVKSPYLWSKTNIYTKGKYVSDGKFSPNAASAQVGAAPQLKQLGVFSVN